MHARFSLFPTLALLVAILPLGAQEVTVPEVQNSPVQFSGIVSGNSVYVRSGPAETYYPTTKLDRGTPVTVVGIKFDWLKIVPPEGSFCYVPKAFVEKRGDGSIGRVTQEDLRVYAGSALNQVKTQVQTRLKAGTDVIILGEQDEYLKIKPPTTAYLYIHKNFVTPVQPVNTGGQTPVAATPTTSPTEQPVATVAPTPAPVEPTPAPTTQSIAMTAEMEKFDAAEAAFKAADGKAIEEQPLPELLARYQSLATSDKLPESMRRTAEYRVRILKVRSDARAQLLEVRKLQEEMNQRALSLKAEQQELQERLAGGVAVFTAVGTLQPSSLQQGTGTLYRLTDPATGRTIVYIRSPDEKTIGMLNKFVGVRGDITTDEQLNLKVITVTELLPVDPNKVNQGVSARVVPPSMLGQGSKKTE